MYVLMSIWATDLVMDGIFVRWAPQNVSVPDICKSVEWKKGCLLKRHKMGPHKNKRNIHGFTYVNEDVSHDHIKCDSLFMCV